MSEQAPAIVGIAALAVDRHDPAGLARWWSRLHLDLRDPEGNELCLLRPRP
ncbi:MAG TPA: hypothetical protein VHM23_15355 [Actinomycetota bacterium]|jgi:hypothetical protein|nr:hypothetical protein [Actinomycetota bacterium]